MVLKGVSWVDNTKIRSNSLEKSQKGTLTQFYHCVPYWLLSRPFDLIFVLSTQLTPFKTIWTNFIIVYPNDSFQDHLTEFYHYVPNWLLSRPYDPIWSLCTPLTAFKTIWPNFIIVYPFDSFQYHMTYFLCWKESIGYTIIKLGQMVLERSHLGTQW